MMRHELTVGAWLEFLNDPATRREIAAQLAADPPRLVSVPRASYAALDPLWQERNGAFVPCYLDGKPVDVRLPVTYVSHEDVRAYLAWRRERDGLPWRLPTEAEWQLAVAGGDGRAYPWGDHPDPGLCYSHPTAAGAGGRIARPVGSFHADLSIQGVADLAGSVAEFVTPVWTRVAEPYAVLCGGSFTDQDAYRFAAYGRRLIDARVPLAGVGCRLVLPLAEP